MGTTTTDELLERLSNPEEKAHAQAMTETLEKCLYGLDALRGDLEKLRESDWLRDGPPYSWLMDGFSADVMISVHDLVDEIGTLYENATGCAFERSVDNA